VNTYSTSYELLRHGLDAPICLTWEITAACNLTCRHCASSSGRRRPNELTTGGAKRFVDELAELQVFYVNVGGGEPLMRRDFRKLVDYCVARGVGVKFSTNGTLLSDSTADWIASHDYVDVQISLDGARRATNDRIRGTGTYVEALTALDRLAAREIQFSINLVVTRANCGELDQMHKIAADHGALLRVTRFRPSGRGVGLWQEQRPTLAQNRQLYEWLRNHSDVVTGDSFFHLSAFGEPLPGINLCGAGRIVCLVDPVGDIYACPFATSSEFMAGNMVEASSFGQVWAHSDLFQRLRHRETEGKCPGCAAFDTCHGGCMAVKLLTGGEMDDPDPDCVLGPIALQDDLSRTDSPPPLLVRTP